MQIRWAEIYANTEILSPIDLETWQVIADTSKIGPSSNVIELASGKGAFAAFLAQRVGCRVEGYDHNPEFVDYSDHKAREFGLRSKLRFVLADVRQLEISPNAYDLGVCLGALYIFREEGWKVLMRGVKPGGYLAISDLVCKKPPAPKDIMEVFFEEPNEPLTRDEMRKWYTSRGAEIVREIECSQEAWLTYYDLQKQMLLEIAKSPDRRDELREEVEEELRQDRLVREYREPFMDYVTFIMKKG